MATPRLLDDIGAKLSELAANSPARDIEKNVKAMLGSALSKLDLVTREEFEVQREVLARQKEIGEGKLQPFRAAADVRDNEGKVVIPQGQALSDAQILQMNWLAEGVQGRIHR